MDYKQIASYGRNGDTELMHVSKSEVATLKGLGALTTNPHTGLPEAFQLSDLMPLLGVGASFFLGPLAGAAVSGVGTALKTHSLGQGLMSGLASWGMGSLLSGAGGATSAATDATANAAANTAGGTAANATGSQLGDTAASYGNFSDVPTAGEGFAGAGQGAMNPAQMAAQNAPGQTAGGGFFSGAPYNNPDWHASNLQGNLGSSDWWATQKPAGYAAGIGAYGLSALQEQQKQADAANALNASNQAKLNPPPSFRDLTKQINDIAAETIKAQLSWNTIRLRSF